MRVVVDTNVLIASIGLKSPYRLIFDKIKTRELEIALSNDILSEYNEILSLKMNKSTADNLIKFFNFSSNVIKINIFFFWELMTNDPSDNKFVDCYIASNSDFIITNDKHFEILNRNEFPKVNIISADDFLELLRK